MSLEPDAELAQLFLQEGHENVDLLQESLLCLERSPGDPDAIRDAFRAAHSLKGMAGAMGHDDLAALTHVLEDVLGEIRDGVARASSELVGAMLVGVDLMLTKLEMVAAEDPTTLDTAAIVEQLRDLRTAQEHSSEREDPTAAAGPAAGIVEAVRQAGLDVLCVEIRTEPGSLMPAVRAYAAVLQAQDYGELLESSPSISELEEGVLLDGSVMVWIATSHRAEHIGEELGACTEIASVSAHAWVPLEDRSPGATLDANGAAAPVENAERRAGSGDGALGSRSRTVRVDSDRLDALMHSVGELLVCRSRVENIARGVSSPDLTDALDELSRAARDMQAMVMDVRMVSIDVVFRRLPRLVRDLAQTLGKDVDLQLSGGDTELDRTVIDLLGDPLIHLVRNAMDHGIEGPEERESRGKPARGTLSVSASAAGGIVLLRVRDDGSGMDPARIQRTAIERGVVSEAEALAMSDEQTLQLCFAPGFSTREEVTELSGRGVGLDVVRSSVRSLGGDIAIDSSDEGTQMTIKLPLTLAIVPVLLVRCGSHTYALPVTRVRSIIESESALLVDIGSQPSIDLGDRVLPVHDLPSLLGEAAGDEALGQVVLLDAADSTMALRVHDVLTQSEVVTRPIPGIVGASPYLSASATLGDGEIAFLIDTEAVAQAAHRRMHVA